ncbi:MAG: hypothetical protein OEW29_05685, partial [Acidimicrobiia bacterium]|nr:hypothetical protein [Acidimicrobiia bacterium]
MEEDQGAVVGAGNGAVVRAGRLTIVIGPASGPFPPDSPVPTAALAAADRLDREQAWDFDRVASALHQLVIEFDPQGVAALLDSGPEPMIFLFDRADALERGPGSGPNSQRRHSASGRAGWTTEVVMGPVVHLSLREAPAAPSWARLRSGLVAGASVTVTLQRPEESVGGPAPEVEAARSTPMADVAPPPPEPAPARVDTLAADAGPGVARADGPPPPPPGGAAPVLSRLGPPPESEPTPSRLGPPPGSRPAPVPDFDPEKTSALPAGGYRPTPDVVALASAVTDSDPAATASATSATPGSLPPPPNGLEAASPGPAGPNGTIGSAAAAVPSGDVTQPSADGAAPAVDTGADSGGPAGPPADLAPGSPAPVTASSQPVASPSDLVSRLGSGLDGPGRGELRDAAPAAAADLYDPDTAELEQPLSVEEMQLTVVIDPSAIGGNRFGSEPLPGTPPPPPGPSAERADAPPPPPPGAGPIASPPTGAPIDWASAAVSSPPPPDPTGLAPPAPSSFPPPPGPGPA